MNEEEFLKEHPSLEGKGWVITSFEPIPIGRDSIKGEIEAYYEKPLDMEKKKLEDLCGLVEPPKLVLTTDIHETQLDKVKVKEVIDKDIKKYRKAQKQCKGEDEKAVQTIYEARIQALEFILKKLGLE